MMCCSFSFLATGSCDQDCDTNREISLCVHGLPAWLVGPELGIRGKCGEVNKGVP